MSSKTAEKMIKMKSVSGKVVDVPESDVERRKFYGYKIVKPEKKKKTEVKDG